MPNIIFKPKPMVDPYALKRNEGLKNLMEVIAQSRKLRQERRQKEAIFRALQGPGTDEQKRARVLEAIRSTGGDTEIGRAATRAELARIMEPPYERQRRLDEAQRRQLDIEAKTEALSPENILRKKEYEDAQIAATQARTKYYEGGGTRRVTPISHAGMEAHDKSMDAYLKTAEKGRWGKADYTQENLLKAWGNFKVDVGFDSLDENKQHQIWQRWNQKVATKGKKSEGWIQGSEYQWDPESEEVRAAGPSITTAAPATGQRPSITTTAPATGQGIEPQSLEEFYQVVDDLKRKGDMENARAYYDQWGPKWQ